MVAPQTYPGTNVLENLLGEKDFKALQDKEADITAVKSAALFANPTLITLTFDFQHLQSIHRYLFCDIYTWAGQIRSFNTLKGRYERYGYGGGDIFTPASEIMYYTRKEVDVVKREIHKRVAHARGEQVRWLSELLARLNKIHHFPDGNGRTYKIYISHIARYLGFDFQWQSIDKEMYRILMQRTHRVNPSNPDSVALDPDAYPVLEKTLLRVVVALQKV